MYNFKWGLNVAESDTEIEGNGPCHLTEHNMQSLKQQVQLQRPYIFRNDENICCI